MGFKVENGSLQNNGGCRFCYFFDFLIEQIDSLIAQFI